MLGKPSADAARKSASRALLRLAAEMQRELTRFQPAPLSWFCWAAGTALAQTPFGTITGMTRDPAGAVLAGVQVNITIARPDSRASPRRPLTAVTASSPLPGAYQVTGQYLRFESALRKLPALKLARGHWST